MADYISTTDKNGEYKCLFDALDDIKKEGISVTLKLNQYPEPLSEDELDAIYDVYENNLELLDDCGKNMLIGNNLNAIFQKDGARVELDIDLGTHAITSTATINPNSTFITNLPLQKQIEAMALAKNSNL